MPWFKISDDWLDHPKVQRAGKNGRALWVAVGNRCAKYSSDGWIEGDLIKGIAALAEVPLGPTVKKLVELKLWHGPDELKRCQDCSRDIDTINAHRRADGHDPLRLAPGDYYFHGWAEHQLSKHRTISVEARMAEDRSRALRKDPTLCRAIQERDRGRCRYCGRRVSWQDRRGPGRATYDHLDPFCFAPNGGNFIEGVVVACGPCNSDKAQRTHIEWATEEGHTLKPPGWSPNSDAGPAAASQPAATPPPAPPSDQAGTWPEPGPDLIQTPNKPGSGPGSPHGHGRPGPGLGPGQVGLDPGPGSGQVGFGLGGAGAGPGLAGLVRSGLGGDGSAAGAPSATTDLGVGDPPATTDASNRSLHEGPSS